LLSCGVELDPIAALLTALLVDKDLGADVRDLAEYFMDGEWHSMGTAEWLGFVA
jgi:hypothetical protein